MPDRLSVMLRFLATEEDAEGIEIMDWCIVRTLKKMVAQFDGKSNPYQRVLQALLWVLKDGWGEGATRTK